MAISRRELLRTGGRYALVAGVAGGAPLAALGGCAGEQEQEREQETVTVEIKEGTNVCAVVSPDRRTVAMDLLGVLWTVPLEGGLAEELTGDFADATQPDWSADGRRIVFQSYRDGYFHIWAVDVDGTRLRQLTTGPHDDREPRFSPDGLRVAFSSDRSGSYGIYTLDVQTGKIATWADGEQDEGAPAWSPDGRTIAFTVGEKAIDAVDQDGSRRTLTSITEGRLDAPSWSPGGRDVAYAVTYDGRSRLVFAGRTLSGAGEEVFPFRAQWLSSGELFYTADGTLRRRWITTGVTKDVDFTAPVSFTRPSYTRRVRDLDGDGPRPVRGIAAPALSPDGQRVAFCALNDLWLMTIGERPSRLTQDLSYVTDPAWSPDGRSLCYTSDRAGNPDLWVRDLDTGQERRLTAPPRTAVAAAWSPDGTRIAFQNREGATFVADLGSGETRQVLGPLFAPGRPSWSPDGNVLTFAALRPASKRYREGTSQILTLDLRTSAVAYHEPAPSASLSTRGYDGPVWSPDGTRMAFVVGSLLHVLPVDAAGRPTGPARQVTDEVTDAPSWSGDSRTILYLSNGRLRLVDADGGVPRTVPLQLTWAAARPSGRTVIHAGRLWDGRGPEVREDVDIVVDGNRIVEVRPHRTGGAGRGSAPGATIDASTLTVLPGLVDMHVHVQALGKFVGSRQGRLWLSFGITTTRSPGDPVYQALEEREATSAGDRLGPRYFGTGEPLDGARVYYHFMRPLRSADELTRELERAHALDYDLVKTYVRLPVAHQRQVVDAAHRHGIWVTSHYLYPAVRAGVDGMEHMGATNRLGYSQTMTRLGRGYQDVVALFSASGLALTPTLFTSRALYATDDAFLDDPRVVALYPEWERQALRKKVATARTPAERATKDVLAASVATLAAIHRSGGLVVCGTDAPIDNIGVSLHQNLRAMVAYGMTPYEALVTATRNPARALGLADQLGTVEPGKLADLVLVSGDPLRDIAAAANVEQVMRNGELYRVDDLLQLPTSTDPPLLADVQLAAAPASGDLWWHAPGGGDPGRGWCGFGGAPGQLGRGPSTQRGGRVRSMVSDERELLARDRLTRSAYDYFAGGADDELTVADNVAAWRRLRLRPHVLRDVAKVSTATTVLGTPVAMPVLVAPTGYQRLAHDEGERAMARGAAAAGTIMIASTVSTVTLEDIAAAAPTGVRWFQLYVRRDRSWTAELVARAVAAGYGALVFTVDVPVLGLRRRDEANQFCLPPGMVMANVGEPPPSGAGSGLAAYAASEFDPGLTFADIAWLRGLCELPILVKGVLRGDDARACVDAGAAGIIVSNHGGRQLDTAIATADALPEVVEAVGGDAEVIVDGGVRRGTDVLKALALGARAVLVGRPALWGLATGGSDGVRAVLEGLGDELARALALCGTPAVTDVTADLVAGVQA